MQEKKIPRFETNVNTINTDSPARKIGYRVILKLFITVSIFCQGRPTNLVNPLPFPTTW